MKINLRIFTTVSAILLAGVSLAGCVSDVDGYDSGPRYRQHWNNDGPRREWGQDRPRYERPRYERPRYDRDNERRDRPQMDRGDRPSRPDWRGRDERRNNGDDRGRHRRWMQDDQ